MELRDITLTEFVVLQALGSVEKSRQLLEQLNPSHAIIHDDTPQDVYYLIDSAKARSLLAQASPGSTLREALHLDEVPATAALESDTDAEEAPDQCVVLEDGRIVGFFDAETPPTQLSSRRGGNGEQESLSPDLVFRSLVAELPKKAHLQDRFSLLVSLSAARRPRKGSAMPIVLPIGTEVDVVVQPRRGLAVEGPTEGTLTISDEKETLPLQFKLRGVTVGIGQLQVFAFHQGQPLGALTLKVKVVEPQEPLDPQTLSHEWALDTVSFSAPDLSLIILEHTDTRDSQPSRFG